MTKCEKKSLHFFPGGETMGRHIKSTMVVFLGLSLLIGADNLSAAPYYERKVINIIVGYGPGGGYDRMARLLAKHLPKYIPGKPAVTIQNMEGADSMIAANHLYRVAKPDGFTIGTFNRGLMFAQLLKGEGVRFDLMKFSWIGSAAMESTVLAIRTDFPHKTPEDFRKVKTPIMLGDTGPAGSSGQFPLLLKELAGFNFKAISYPSQGDIYLAIERKELDGAGASYSSVRPLIERGVVVPLIRGRVSEPGIENLPLDEDFAPDKMGKTLMSMRSVPDSIGRPYVAPPETPAEAMKILRDAFALVSRDPELREDSRKVSMTVEYVSAEETLKIMGYLLAQPPDIVKEFGKYIKF
jgi:tripartite-type tricarboxylate transporter receptor subunit TctC